MFDLYTAMLAESERRGLPCSFTTDLTEHDARFVRTRPLASFVWLLYEGGTHIVRLDGEELAHATRTSPGGPPRGIATAATLYADLAASGRVRMYFATPISLTECRPDELEDVYAGRPGGAPVPFGGRRAGEAR